MKHEEEISVCGIFKRHQGSDREWEFEQLTSFVGDWSDLASELHTTYGQFKDELECLSRPKKYQQLDSIAKRLKRSGVYEFKLRDYTDDWYVAVVKPLHFRIDYDGTIG